MPNAIREYLARFNVALEVGVRSRRQIFLEVSDHLRERFERELRAGASDTEAARRAIAAFGPPEEVARSFQAGMLGALDRQLALRTRRLHRWMASHLWGAAAAKLALLALIYGAVAAVGTLAGARQPLLGSAHLLSWGAMWVLWCSPQAPLRARLRVRPQPRGQYPLDTVTFMAICPFPMVSAWLTMVEVNPFDPFWLLMLLVLLFPVFQWSAYWVTERVLNLVARRSAPSAQDASSSSWKAEHPWRSAFFEIWSAPLALLALVLTYPAPVALRGAFAVVVAAVTLLVALGLCLVRSLREKTSYARSLEEPA